MKSPVDSILFQSARVMERMTESRSQTQEKIRLTHECGAAVGWKDRTALGALLIPRTSSPFQACSATMRRKRTANSLLGPRKPEPRLPRRLGGT
jgi:hypothetical protein